MVSRFTEELERHIQEEIEQQIADENFHAMESMIDDAVVVSEKLGGKLGALWFNSTEPAEILENQAVFSKFLNGVSDEYLGIL